MLINIKGKWYRIDGVGSNGTVHLERVEIEEKYTENYTTIDLGELMNCIQNHIAEMRSLEIKEKENNPNW